MGLLVIHINTNAAEVKKNSGSKTPLPYHNDKDGPLRDFRMAEYEASKKLTEAVKDGNSRAAQRWATTLLQLQMAQKSSETNVVLVSSRDLDRIRKLVEIEFMAFQQQREMEDQVRSWASKVTVVDMKKSPETARKLYKEGEEMHWRMDSTRFNPKLLELYNARMKMMEKYLNP